MLKPREISPLAGMIHPSRMVIYNAALITGYLITSMGKLNALFPSVESGIRLGLAILATISLFLWAKLINDIADLEVDRISSPERPLPSGQLTIPRARQLARRFLVVSFVLILPSGLKPLGVWMAVAVISSLYCGIPFPIRRYFPVGQLAITAIGSILVILGAWIADPRGASFVLTVQRDSFILIVLLAFLMANLKDFKDIEGDRIARYGSLPALVIHTRLTAFAICLPTVAVLTGICLKLGVRPEICMPAMGIYIVGCGFLAWRVRENRHFDRIVSWTVAMIAAMIAARVIFP